jgi:hypothetical protein
MEEDEIITMPEDVQDLHREMMSDAFGLATVFTTTVGSRKQIVARIDLINAFEKYVIWDGKGADLRRQLNAEAGRVWAIFLETYDKLEAVRVSAEAAGIERGR